MQGGDKHPAMGESIEGDKRREQKDQMDGKSALCILERKPFCCRYKKRPSQM